MAEIRKYDLAERTAKFGENIIRLCLTLKMNPISAPIIKQIIRSATRIGANYLEADEAGSKKNFDIESVS